MRGAATVGFQESLLKIAPSPAANSRPNAEFWSFLLRGIHTERAAPGPADGLSDGDRFGGGADRSAARASIRLHDHELDNTADRTAVGVSNSSHSSPNTSIARKNTRHSISDTEYPSSIDQCSTRQNNRIALETATFSGVFRWRFS
jgi:hypothetical protein